MRFLSFGSINSEKKVDSFGICQVWTKLDRKYKAALWGVLLCGLLAHGMVMTNHLYFHDDINTLFGFGNWFISIGRWFLNMLSMGEEAITGTPQFILPLPYCVISLFFAAVISCLLIKLLNIRSCSFAFLVSAVVSTYPVVACMFGYLHAAPYYMLSVLLAVYGAKLCSKMQSKYSVTVGILLGCLSLSIYQAYFTFFLLILMFSLIKLITNNPQVQSVVIIKRIAYSVLFSLCVLLIYYVVMKVSLWCANVSLTSYKSADKFHIDAMVFLNRIPLAYKTFFLVDENLMYSRRFYFAFLILFIIYAIWTNIKIYIANKTNGFILSVILLFLPIATDVNYILFTSEDVYPLMQYGNVLVFVLFLWFIERSMNSATLHPIAKYSMAACIFFMTMIIYVFVKFDNTCYMKAVINQKQAICYFTTLVTQIKSLPSYSADKEVVFINDKAIEDPSLTNLWELHPIQLSPYLDIEQYINNYKWFRYMQLWCGFSPKLADKKAFESLPEVIAMPAYPDAHSIKEINNTIVVKLGKYAGQ